MLSAIQQLLDKRRFEECRNLAEETLRNSAQTTSDTAFCHYAVARCSLEVNDVLQAVKAGEQALTLVHQLSDLNMERLVLMDLANAYGRLRRYPTEGRALQRLLKLLESPPQAKELEPQAWHALGQNWLHKHDYPAAVRCFNEAIVRAEASGDDALAESSRRLLRAAAIRAGRLDEAAELFAASRAFLKHHPKDQVARFWYWHDKSDLAMANDGRADARRAAWQAVNIGTGDVPLEFAGYMLHYRHALAMGQPAEAMRFACDARVSALHGERFDLAHEAVDAMIQLMKSHGDGVVTGLASYYARRGVDLARYVPEQFLRLP